MKTFKYKEHKFKTFTVLSYQFSDECEVSISTVPLFARFAIGPRFAIAKTKRQALEKLKSSLEAPLGTVGYMPASYTRLIEFIHIVKLNLQELIDKQPIESSTDS